MTNPQNPKLTPKVSVSIRIALGLLGGIIAATVAHFAIGELLTTVVAAIFFGVAIAITVGSIAADGAGGDGGGR